MAGEMFTSAASFDPTFWPLHGAMERLLDLKRIYVAQQVRSCPCPYQFLSLSLSPSLSLSFSLTPNTYTSRSRYNPYPWPLVPSG